MNRTSKLLRNATIAMAATIVTATATPSLANNTRLVQLKSEGFEQCKAIGNAGVTGVVHGKTADGGGFNSASDRSFFLRYCFNSKSECKNFVNRINHIVTNVTEITYRSCSVR